MLDPFTGDWTLGIDDILRILIALVLALPLAWERSHRERNIGLRTFPIVALASCVYMLMGEAIPGADAGARARVMQGLLSGIGFIGGGAIVKQGVNVRGLATAASIWNTGAIGVAVALDRVELAIAISITNFLILRLLTPLTDKEREADDDEADSGGNDGKG